MRTEDFKMKKILCPYCQSKKVIPILYGLIGPSPEMFKKLDKGEIKLGGCVIHENNPTHYCVDCKKSFKGEVAQ